MNNTNTFSQLNPIPHVDEIVDYHSKVDKFLCYGSNSLHQAMHSMGVLSTIYRTGSYIIIL